MSKRKQLLEEIISLAIQVIEAGSRLKYPALSPIFY
jgi:hypothetical protein